MYPQVDVNATKWFLGVKSTLSHHQLLYTPGTDNFWPVGN